MGNFFVFCEGLKSEVLNLAAEYEEAEAEAEAEAADSLLGAPRTSFAIATRNTNLFFFPPVTVTNLSATKRTLHKRYGYTSFRFF